VRYDRSGEWRTRVEALVGPILTYADASDSAMAARYTALTPTGVSEVARHYGAGYFVAAGAYPFTQRFRAGPYRVYELPRP
jgi:hypothetical protein